MFRFQELEIWKRSIVFAQELSKVADNLPRKEQFSLSEQLRRASLSICSNIAEGSGKRSMKEFCHHLDIAKGSVYEVANLVIICQGRGYIEDSWAKEPLDKAEELAKMISGFINNLRKRQERP